jgi:propionyl-CoA carboxylase alpha chain
MFYDPMISKLSTWAPTRLAAIDAMGEALETFHIEGLGHNIPFLVAVMDEDRFRSGQLSTSYIKDQYPEGFQGTAPTARQTDLQIAAACAMHQVLSERAWPGRGRNDWVVNLGGVDHPVRLSHDGGVVRVELTETGRSLALTDITWRPGQPVFSATLDGVRFTVQVRPAAEGFVIRHRAAEARVLVLTPVSALLHKRLPPKKAADTAKLVLSPMPGLVVSLDVVAGQEVKAGEVVAIIEAMKMQNIIRAERDGVVKMVGPKAGDSVAADEVLAEFA